VSIISVDLISSVSICRLGGVVVSCLPLDLKVAGLNPAEAMDFKGEKNPLHTFLRMTGKARGPM
jgi:hypothetical protein